MGSQDWLEELGWNTILTDRDKELLGFANPRHVLCLKYGVEQTNAAFAERLLRAEDRRECLDAIIEHCYDRLDDVAVGFMASARSPEHVGVSPIYREILNRAKIAIMELRFLSNPALKEEIRGVIAPLLENRVRYLCATAGVEILSEPTSLDIGSTAECDDTPGEAGAASADSGAVPTDAGTGPAQSPGKAYASPLGRNIDMLRAECFWTYDELAAKTGLEKSQIIRHVKGAGARMRALGLYAAAFGKKLNRTVTARDLLS